MLDTCPGAAAEKTRPAIDDDRVLMDFAAMGRPLVAFELFGK